MRFLTLSLCFALSAVALPVNSAQKSVSTRRPGPAHATLSGYKGALAEAWRNGVSSGVTSGLSYSALASLGSVLTKPSTTAGASVIISGHTIGNIGGAAVTVSLGGSIAGPGSAGTTLTLGASSSTVRPITDGLILNGGSNLTTLNLNVGTSTVSNNSVLSSGGIQISSPFVYNTVATNSLTNSITTNNSAITTGTQTLAGLTKVGTSTVVSGASVVYTGSTTVGTGGITISNLPPTVLSTTNGISFSTVGSNLPSSGILSVNGLLQQVSSQGMVTWASPATNGITLSISPTATNTSVDNPSVLPLADGGINGASTLNTVGPILLHGTGQVSTLSISGGVINKR